MRSSLAHISDVAAGVSPWLIAALVAATIALIVQHHLVAGFDRTTLAARAKVGVAVGLVVATIALIAPAGGAQSDSALLPDLISDPPRPSFLSELTTADGSRRLVATFDGYVHNIGQGPLDVVGNPQLPDGMRQRVRNGDTWEDVGAPTVRYETDDGHNHFHLIEAIEYVLWNELQGSQAAIGSKIGFCLVDSEQMEPGTDQAYSEELDNFCEENNPGAESLRMGISSGWRDIYDDTTTLQWVDISDVAPGRYWIGAITDPNDEILESNESNNELIFSDRTIAVPGYAPRSAEPIAVTDGFVEFTLRSTPHGDVGTPLYVIEQGPSNGRLDVPVGTDLGSPTVRYFPDDGFTGTDTLVFSVHDAASPYPSTHPTQELQFDVIAGEASTAASGTGQPPAISAPSTFFESTRGEHTSVAVTVSDSIGGPARLYASGLPAGLAANAETGEVSGIALDEGIFAVEFVAVGSTPDERTSLEVQWIVNPQIDSTGLVDVPDRSSPRGELTRVSIADLLGLELEAQGLPPGIELEASSGQLLGSPTEIGEHVVTIRHLDGATVVDERSFTWTIRRTTAIDFVF